MSFTAEEKSPNVVIATTELLGEERARVMGVFFAGAIGGVVSRTMTAPMDRIRLVAAGRGMSVTAAVKSIQRDGSAFAFWKGNGMNCIKIAPETALRLAMADMIKRAAFGTEESSIRLHQRFIAGALGGLVGQVAVYPLEVLRTQLATAPRGMYRGIGDCARRVYSRSGPSGFYRGLGTSMVGIIPYAGADIAFFETLKAAHQRRVPGELAAPTTMALGACASAGAQLLSYPFALVRTRMQAEASQSGRTARQLVRYIWAKDGLRGFYRGVTPNLAKMVPASAVNWLVIETVKQRLHL